MIYIYKRVKNQFFIAKMINKYLKRVSGYILCILSPICCFRNRRVITRLKKRGVDPRNSMRTWLNLLANNIFLSNRNQPAEVYDKISKDENIQLTTEDNQTIWGILLKPQNMNENTHCYVVCHGKGTDRVRAVEKAKLREFLPSAGDRCFFTIDYRNFGGSTGEFNYEDVSYDVDAAIKYLRETHKIKKISLVAHSMGGGVVFEYYKFLKDKKDAYVPKEIHSFATFTSVMDCLDEFPAYRWVKWFPGIKSIVPGDFAYDNVANIKYLKDKGVAVNIFHGKQDKTIKYKQGQELYEALKKEGIKAHITLRDDKGHDSLFGERELWNMVIEGVKMDGSVSDSNKAPGGSKLSENVKALNEGSSLGGGKDLVQNTSLNNSKAPSESDESQSSSSDEDVKS